MKNHYMIDVFNKRKDGECGIKTYGLMFAVMVLACVMALAPDTAHASTAFSGIESVFTAFKEFITGPVGKMIAIAGMVCCGVVYIFARQDMSEGFKMLLQVCFGICFICFASAIVDGLFDGWGGGALI